MIYITGDCHSDVRRFSADSFYEQKDMNQDEDFVIVLGDFGLIWNHDGESKAENWWLDWLEEKPFTTLFVCGNHENFDRLYQYPVKEWNDGKVHEIRPHVLHLMRGEVFNICDKKFFAFGGASSHDISDGILDYDDKNWKDKAKALDKKGKYMYRVKGLSWWDRELPTEEEMQNGINNLEKHDWKVDYILSHTPPASVIALLGHGLYEQDILTKYLEEIRRKTEFKRHFAGHMHVSRQLNDRDILLYEQIVRIV